MNDVYCFSFLYRLKVAGFGCSPVASYSLAHRNKRKTQKNTEKIENTTYSDRDTWGRGDIQSGIKLQFTRKKANEEKKIALKGSKQKANVQ